MVTTSRVEIWETTTWPKLNELLVFGEDGLNVPQPDSARLVRTNSVEWEKTLFCSVILLLRAVARCPFLPRVWDEGYTRPSVAMGLSSKLLRSTHSFPA